MKLLSLVVALIFSLPNLPALAQTSSSASNSSAQAASLLRQSAAAMTGNVALTDVTLSGTARRIAGSDDDTGTATLKALATGESRVDLSFPSGPRSEVRANSSSGPVGSWLGPDGNVHAISQHNLWSDASWFFPAFTLSRLLSTDYVVSYVGHETRNGQAVEHLTAVRQFDVTGAPPNWSPTALQRLTAIDVYLDSTTLLPVVISFNVHPDRNRTIDIPVEIRLSDYRQAGAARAPFHIQKFLNNSLALEIQINAANLNTGLSPSTFNLQ